MAAGALLAGASVAVPGHEKGTFFAAEPRTRRPFSSPRAFKINQRLRGGPTIADGFENIDGKRIVGVFISQRGLVKGAWTVSESQIVEALEGLSWYLS